MYQNLICYKTLPIWTTTSLPEMFQHAHNTKIGTWAKLTLFKGQLTFYYLNDSGEIIDKKHLTANTEPLLIAPQVWHKVQAASNDLECQLQFLCEPKDYFSKKYNLTPTHSEVLFSLPYLHQANFPPAKVLDLGCGRGRNTLFLAQQGFSLTAVDHNQESLSFLKQIAEKEKLAINTEIYDINTATISDTYDFILSTVVLMFLQPNRINAIIKNMQQQTNLNGYNLIVAAMSTKDVPCPVAFPFTFSENQLKEYYQNWEIIKYNENLGELHRTDSQGNRIKLKFATLLAKKIHP